MNHFTKIRFVVALPAVLVFFAALIFYAPETAARAFIPPDLEIRATYRHGKGQSVGTVKTARPQAYIMHSDRQYGYVAKKGLPLYSGDTLFTRKDGKLAVSFKDGSETVLAANSSLVINKSVYDPEGGNRLSFMEMISGKARFVVKKLAEYKHSRFSVKTASSVVGVRGSDFILEISQDGNRTIITALDNTVLEVVDPANPLAEPVTVTSFQQLVTVLGEVLGTPEDIPKDQLRQRLQELGLMGDDNGEGDGDQPSAGDEEQNPPSDYVPDDSPDPEDPVFYPEGDSGQTPPPPLPPLSPDVVPPEDDLTGDSDTIFQQEMVLPDMPGPPTL
ncbi:MAG: FecR domain-containing protein [Desulfosudaceae bacterium]